MKDSTFKHEELKDYLLKEKNNKIGKEWKEVHKDKTVEMFQNTNEEIFTFKAYMTFKNVKASVIFNLICDTKLRSKWDPYYLKEEIIETISEKEDVIYIQIKTPKGISNRDNCLHRKKKKKKIFNKFQRMEGEFGRRKIHDFESFCGQKRIKSRLCEI
jgi:hypothetical protein